MNIAEFYNNPDLADGFGSTAGGRKNPHRGLDFPKALGTPVPAYVGGTVVTSTYESGLGNIIEIRGDDGRYQGYRHLRTPMNSKVFATVGKRVEKGDIIAEVSDTGSLAYGYHLCTTNASAKGGVYGNSLIVSDPWPYIKAAINGTDGGLSPILASGPDWAFRQPTGELAKRIGRALIARGRVVAGFVNDGDPGIEWRKGVQRTLAISGVFNGTIDGNIQRGGSYGIQQYGAKFGDYTARGGVIDGRPGLLSWDSFALGLERP